MNVSFFKNGIVDTTPTGDFTFEAIFKAVKEGRWLGIVNQLRVLEYGSEPFKTHKKKLPYFTPHCTINGERVNVNAAELSGLFCFDLDYSDNKNVALDELKTIMVYNSFIHSFFDSPSEKGLKFFVKVKYEREQFKRAYEYTMKYFQQVFGIKLDIGQGNLSQACFISYDPNAFYNPDSEIFIPVLIDATEIAKEITHHTGDVYDLIKHILNKQNIQFVDGNKHNYLFHFASLANKFGIQKEDCISYININIENGVIKTNCVESPYKLYYGSFGSIKFEPAQLKTHEVIKGAAIHTPTKDVISKDFLINSLMDYFDNGFPVAQSTGVSFLDPYLRFQKGWLYLLYGMASMGKSSFSRFLFASSALEYGNKFAIYAFEESVLSYVNKLVQVVLGQNVMKRYTNRATRNEYKEALLFICDHFFMVYPETDFSLKNIEDNFKRLHDKHGLFGVNLDPLNQVELPNMISISEQWKEFYMKRKIFAVKEDLMYFNTSHPIKQIKQDGEYVMPDWQNIDGGAMHGNKNDVVIAYHRPYFISDQNDTTVHIKVWKVKDHEIAGVPGMIEVEYNRASARYIQKEGNPMF